MDYKQLSGLLAKYLKGECSDEETAIVDQWYAKYESEPDILDGVEHDKIRLVEEKMLANILAKSTVVEDFNETANVRPKAIFSRLWVKIAAAAIVLLVGKFVFFDLRTKTAKRAPQSEQIYLLNNSSHIIKQTLADGSVVWLKPNASLKFPKKFASSSRNVSMSGECFFDVAKDASHPFIVTSAHMVTKVLGTSFQVVDHDGAKEAFVTVVTGRVLVQKKGKQHKTGGSGTTEVVLRPDDKVLYNENRGEFVASKIPEADELTLWKQQNLAFDNKRLEEVVKVLSKRFNIQIQLADASLANEKMTANFDELNLAEILDVVKVAMKIDYKISDDLITLSKPTN